MARVVVTGGSGFLGSHCVARLLDAGHQVRATIRHENREAPARAMLLRAGTAGAGRIEFAVADLSVDAGWAEAMSGCDYALHLASPHPPSRATDDARLIRTARDGTLRVLRAAWEAGVRRVVLTSSFVAVGYGGEPRTTPYTEEDWTDHRTPNTAYVRSKTIAEREAWSFAGRGAGGTELCVINPVAIFGPVLGADYAPPIAIVKRMLDGGMPAVARVSFGVVDVRDVADLHVTAMVHPAAAGERFLAVAGDPVSMWDIAEVLRRRVGPAAGRLPRWELADRLTRIAAVFRPTMGATLDELGRYRASSNAKARRLLGWSPRTSEDAIVATAESLIELGLVEIGGCAHPWWRAFTGPPRSAVP